MTVEKRLSAPKRRSRAEVQQLVAEFVSSGMRRSEFCRSRGLSFGTLNRHAEPRLAQSSSSSHFWEYGSQQLRIGLFTVDLGNVQPPSSWRILALNALNMLVLVVTVIASPFWGFSLSIFLGFKAFNLSNYLMERLNMGLTRGDAHEESSLDRR